MKIYPIGPQTGQQITAYDSKGFVLTRVLRLAETAVLSFAYLEAGSVIGHHPASGDQLFIVIAGVGEVRGDENVWHPIAAGQAAFWQDGEWHETRSRAGLTAVLVEADKLDVAQYLR